MTFRSAALIHKRHHHPKRRIVPGVAFAAVAIAAAVLFLATSGAARADSTEVDSTTSACDGLTSVVLTASSAGTVSGSSSAPSANCDLSVEVQRIPASTRSDGQTGSAAEPCVVTATPSALGNRGAKVSITHSGDCDGFEARWTVRPSASVSGSSSATTNGTGANGASSTNSDAYALLEGYDNEVAKILMFENKSRAYWVSTPTSVVRARHYPSQRGYPTTIGGVYLGDGWTVTYAFPQLTALSDSLYEASNSANFTIHVPVFADPSAQTRADLYLLPNGLFSCAFRGTWTNPDLGFHFESYCRFTS